MSRDNRRLYVTILLAVVWGGMVGYTVSRHGWADAARSLVGLVVLLVLIVAVEGWIDRGPDD